MTYRDDLAAALARAEALERDLELLRRQGGARAGGAPRPDVDQTLAEARRETERLREELRRAHDELERRQIERASLDYDLRVAEERRAEVARLGGELGTARAEAEKQAAELAAARARIEALEREVKETRRERQLRDGRALVSVTTSDSGPCCAAALRPPVEVASQVPGSRVWDLELPRFDGGATWAFRRGVEQPLGSFGWTELWYRGTTQEVRAWAGAAGQALRAPLEHEPLAGQPGRAMILVEEPPERGRLVLLAREGGGFVTRAERALPSREHALGPASPDGDHALVRAVGRVEGVSLTDLSTTGAWLGPGDWPAWNAHFDETGRWLLCAFAPPGGPAAGPGKLLLYSTDGRLCFDLGAPADRVASLDGQLPEGLDVTLRLSRPRVTVSVRAP